jgi:hypothetical protein
MWSRFAGGWMYVNARDTHDGDGAAGPGGGGPAAP